MVDSAVAAVGGVDFRRAWVILRGHLWLALFALLGLLAIGRAGGLIPVLRPRLPSVDLLAIIGTYAATGDVVEALSQPGVAQILEVLLRLSNAPLSELVPGLTVLFSVALALLTVALVADGAMISAVDQAEEHGSTTFGAALRTGLKNTGHLFLLASVPATPVLVTMISLAVSLLAFLTAEQSGNLTNDAALQGAVISLICAGVLLVPFGVVSIIFEALRQLANRSCVMEGTRFFGAFRRAWQVFRTEPGPFVIVFLVRAAVGSVASTLLFIPSLFLLGIPLLWVVNTALKAYFATLWSLTWRRVSAGVPLTPG